MKLIHHFERNGGLPCNWPDDYESRIEIIEDGDEDTLEIAYADTSFRRPLAPWTADDVRTAYGKQEPKGVEA